MTTSSRTSGTTTVSSSYFASSQQPPPSHQQKQQTTSTSMSTMMMMTTNTTNTAAITTTTSPLSPPLSPTTTTTNNNNTNNNNTNSSSTNNNMNNINNANNNNNNNHKVYYRMNQRAPYLVHQPQGSGSTNNNINTRRRRQGSSTTPSASTTTQPNASDHYYYHDRRKVAAAVTSTNDNKLRRDGTSQSSPHLLLTTTSSLGIAGAPHSMIKNRKDTTAGGGRGSELSGAVGVGGTTTTTTRQRRQQTQLQHQHHQHHHHQEEADRAGGSGSATSTSAAGDTSRQDPNSSTNNILQQSFQRLQASFANVHGANNNNNNNNSNTQQQPQQQQHQVSSLLSSMDPSTQQQRTPYSGVSAMMSPRSSAATMMGTAGTSRTPTTREQQRRSYNNNNNDQMLQNSIDQDSSTTKLDNSIQPDWRLRDRMKTVGVGLIMALNIGTDPPDIIKPYPCSVLQCWIDPRCITRTKARELIGERLEQQYARWQLARTSTTTTATTSTGNNANTQQGGGNTGGGGGTQRPLKYRRALDPTIEDVRLLCTQLRKQATRNTTSGNPAGGGQHGGGGSGGQHGRHHGGNNNNNNNTQQQQQVLHEERVLLHYNGHGVPKPTDHGEIWVFDKNHTEYIPLRISDLKLWLGKPSIVVLDCSNAGVLLPYFISNTTNTTTTTNNTNTKNRSSSSSSSISSAGGDSCGGDKNNIINNNNGGCEAASDNNSNNNKNQQQQQDRGGGGNATTATTTVGGTIGMGTMAGGLAAAAAGGMGYGLGGGGGLQYSQQHYPTTTTTTATATPSVDGAGTTTTTTPAPRPAGQQNHQSENNNNNNTIDMDTLASEWVRDTIVLCPCSENEWLPMHPDYPADIFTSCLTTPIKIALRWFIRKNHTTRSTSTTASTSTSTNMGGDYYDHYHRTPNQQQHYGSHYGSSKHHHNKTTSSQQQSNNHSRSTSGHHQYHHHNSTHHYSTTSSNNNNHHHHDNNNYNILFENVDTIVDSIPGKANDRKTPLGELNWIFTAVTDSIAWNMLPKPLFQRLFRQDLLVASMFRNFLLADRMLRDFHCTPVSYPPLPDGICDHPLWKAWDLACETLLFQLIKDGVLLNNSNNHHHLSTTTTIPANIANIASTTTSMNDTTTTDHNGGITISTTKPMKTSKTNNNNASKNSKNIFDDYCNNNNDGLRQRQQQHQQRHGGLRKDVKSSNAGGGKNNNNNNDTPAPVTTTSISSPFFSEQLTAFEAWLEFASIHKMRLSSGTLELPEQLPVVLQVLLSQVHRIRALMLLRRFLDLGPWAVNLSLSLGIFPYVMRLLQSPEYKSLLVSIWASILAFDPSCRVDLLKDGAFHHFVQHLTWGPSNTVVMDVSKAAKERALASFVLSVSCYKYPAGQSECIRLNLHENIDAILSSYDDAARDYDAVEIHIPAHFRLWLCLCLANVFGWNIATQNEAYAATVHRRLAARLDDRNTDVRAAVCYALGNLVCIPPETTTTATTTTAITTGIQSTIRAQSHHVPTSSQHHLTDTNSVLPSPFPPSGLVLQHLPTAMLPGQLQPTFGGAPPTPTQTAVAGGGLPNQIGGLHQTMTAMGQPIHVPQVAGQPIAVPGAHQFWNQPVQIHPPAHGQQLPLPQQHQHQQQLQTQYMLHAGQQPMPGVHRPPPGMPSPAAFLVGGNPVVAAAHGATTAMISPPRLHHQLPHPPVPLPPPSLPPMTPVKPTVFEDRKRLDLDLSVIEVLIKATYDGSVVVRYEATVALGSAVGKYLGAFVVVAEETAASNAAAVATTTTTTTTSSAVMWHHESSSDSIRSSSTGWDWPRGLERKHVDRFRNVWRVIRSLQHDDPFPAVSRAANDIVSVVHEHLLRIRMERETMTHGNEDEDHDDDDVNDDNNGCNVSEDGIGSSINNNNRNSKGRMGDGVVLHPRKLATLLSGIDEATPSIDVPAPKTPGGVPWGRNDGRARSATPKKQQKQSEMRRVSSEFLPGRTSSMEQSAAMSSSTRGAASVDDGGGQLPDPSMDYMLPQSEYFEWKKSTFDPSLDGPSDDDFDDPDPLSPAGAARSYQERRNYAVRESGRILADRFASLAPKPLPPAKKGIEMILEQPDDDDARIAVEEEASAKKRELELKEVKLLRNDGVTMTSMVNFHPFEDYLMACGERDELSLWETGTGVQLSRFKNGNPKGTRLTTSFWINETSSSLFVTGCDDGTVRVWGDILESNGEVCSVPSSLVSAFYALPMTAGQRGSGLVCEWQPYSGTLIAGGNNSFIRCWDLESEKTFCQLDTHTDAYVTTLTTAWDYDRLGMSSGPSRHHGLGRDVVVAGHSDGSLKIFDIRTGGRGSGQQQKRGGARQRATQYSEHKSWIVKTEFTGYNGMYELISGDIKGIIKAWDLRMPSSIRTVEAQRRTMTTLAVHSKIPLLATGSQAQFIQLLTPDGDTLQVLRYHEKMAGHRIGPVSCLAFHPYKPLLAAGATDAYIGLYSPKRAFSISTP